MKALRKFETSVKMYNTNVPEDFNLGKYFTILIIYIGVNIEGNLISWHRSGYLKVMQVFYFFLLE
jgi:hypothetical protein